MLKSCIKQSQFTPNTHTSPTTQPHTKAPQSAPPTHTKRPTTGGGPLGGGVPGPREGTDRGGGANTARAIQIIKATARHKQYFMGPIIKSNKISSPRIQINVVMGFIISRYWSKSIIRTGPPPRICRFWGSILLFSPTDAGIFRLHLEFSSKVPSKQRLRPTYIRPDILKYFSPLGISKVTPPPGAQIFFSAAISQSF